MKYQSTCSQTIVDSNEQKVFHLEAETWQGNLFSYIEQFDQVIWQTHLTWSFEPPRVLKFATN